MSMTSAVRILSIATLAAFAVVPGYVSHSDEKPKAPTAKQVEAKADKMEDAKKSIEEIPPVPAVSAARLGYSVATEILRTQAEILAKQDLDRIAAQVKADQAKQAAQEAATKKVEAQAAADQKTVSKAAPAVKAAQQKDAAEVEKLLAELKASEKALKEGAVLKAKKDKEAAEAKVAEEAKKKVQTTSNLVPAGRNAPAWLCQVPSGDSNTQAWPRLVRTRILEQFPEISTIGGYRHGDPRDHGKGLALDVMVPPSSILGDDVVRWSLTNFDQLNLSYVIWKQHIWTAERPYWRKMNDRGSITQNHFDHPHLSFKPGTGTCPK